MLSMHIHPPLLMNSFLPLVVFTPPSGSFVLHIFLALCVLFSLLVDIDDLILLLFLVLSLYLFISSRS